MAETSQVLFVNGGYGAGNIGDDAILQGLVIATRLSCPDIQIGAISHNPEKSQNETKLTRVWPASIKGTLSAFKWATHIVLGGATLISEKPSISFPIGYCSTLIDLALLMKKPISMLAVGVSNVDTKAAKKLIQSHYAKYLDVITVRSKNDKEIAIGLGMDPSRILVCADAAFAASHPESVLYRRPSSVNIGLNLVNEGNAERFGYVDSLIQALLQIKSEYPDCSVTGLCSEVRRHKGFDYELVNEVAVGKLSGTIISDYISPVEFMNKLAECLLVITMRMHVLIFCAMTGIPCLPIVREKKTRLMSDSLGIKEVLSLESKPEEIYTKTKMLLQAPELATVSVERIDELRQRAIKNGVILREYIEGKFGVYKTNQACLYERILAYANIAKRVFAKVLRQIVRFFVR